MNPQYVDLVKVLADLSGTVVVVGLLIFAGYKFLSKYGTAFISTQQQMAEAMGRQAQSMADMKDTVCEFVSRDSMEHREILLAVQVVGKELKSLNKQMAEMTDGHERSETQQGAETHLRSLGAGPP